MTVINDRNGAFVNGTIARFIAIEDHEVPMWTDADRVQYQLMACLVLEKEDKEIIHVPSYCFTDCKTKIIDGEPEKMIIATLDQFPVCVAYAITIHKSQGASIDYMVADMSYIFTVHQAYTLLSRARSKDRLQILNWDKRKVKVDPRCFNFYRDIYQQISNDLDTP